MLSGNRHPEEILKSVKNGLYAVDFGGGQVDITSGKFVFTCTEAYKIENGKVTNPVKGATLIGNGPAVCGCAYGCLPVKNRLTARPPAPHRRKSPRKP